VITFHRVSMGNQPFMTGFVAWELVEESAGDRRLYYATEAVSREFIRMAIRTHGVFAARNLIRSIRQELSEEVANRTRFVRSETQSVTFESKVRSHNDWLVMMGVLTPACAEANIA
jgi:hypothetical protein